MKYSVGAFLPQEAMPLLLAVAGVMIIFGLRRFGVIIILFVFADALLEPLLEPIMGLLPGWLILLIMAILALRVFGELTALLIGKGAADTMIGTLAADFVKLLLLIPRMVGRLLLWWLR